MGRLVDLAKAVLASAEEIERSFQHKSLPIPSFEDDTWVNFPPDMHNTQQDLLQASDELTTLVQGPRRFVSTFGGDHNRATSVHAIVRFRIAKALPMDGTSTLVELAQTVGHDEEKFQRIIRHAMTFRFFRETSDGRIAHTAASRALATDDILANFTRTALDELWPAATRVADAIERFPNSEEPSQAGWNVAYADEDPMFTAIDKHPERAKRFADSMKSFQVRPDFLPSHLVEGAADYWSKVGKVVDVGGSSGAIAVALTQKFPDLHCIVQDLPNVLELRETTVPQSVAERVTFMPHDMFQEQPVKDADVYLIRWVLHDWSDLYTAKVIRQIVPAMTKPGAKLIISDGILPGSDAPLMLQRATRQLDLAMMAIQNGRERDEEGWRKVLKEADPRLKVVDIRMPPGSALGILVVTL